MTMNYYDNEPLKNRIYLTTRPEKRVEVYQRQNLGDM